MCSHPFSFTFANLLPKKGHCARMQDGSTVEAGGLRYKYEGKIKRSSRSIEEKEGLACGSLQQPVPRVARCALKELVESVCVDMR